MNFNNQSNNKLLNETTKRELCANYWLAMATQHHSNRTHINDRCYFLTIHFNKLQSMSQSQSVIFNKISDSLAPKGMGSLRPGLILCPDVEGSRNHNPNFHNPFDPHFHGLLFTTDDIEFRMGKDQIIKKTKTAIGSIQGLRSIDPIYVTAYNSPQTPMSKTIDYICKSYWLANRQGISGFEPTAFPFEIQWKRSNEEGQEKLLLERNKLLKELILQEGDLFRNQAHNTPSIFISKISRQLGSLQNEEERKQEICKAIDFLLDDKIAKFKPALALLY